MTKNNKTSLFQKVSSLPWYKRIEVLRVIFGWTQQEVADKVGVDKRIYWNWENGIAIPVKKNRQALSRVYKIPENEIFRDIYSGKRANAVR